jgi:hypothetical protein
VGKRQKIAWVRVFAFLVAFVAVFVGGFYYIGGVGLVWNAAKTFAVVGFVVGVIMWHFATRMGPFKW